MSVITLPTWLEPKADRFASDYVEVELGLKPSDPGYQRAFDKAKHNYCREYYELSTGIQASNPTAKKAKQIFEAFGNILYTDPNGFIRKNFPDKAGMASEEANMTAARLKGDIIHLAHIWLEATHSDKTSMKKSDSAFRRMNYNLKTGEKSVDDKQLRAVGQRRIARAILCAFLNAAVYSVYKVNPSRLMTAIEAATKNIDSRMINTENVFKKLTSKIVPAVLGAYKPINADQVVDLALAGGIGVKETQEFLGGIPAGEEPESVEKEKIEKVFTRKI